MTRVGNGIILLHDTFAVVVILLLANFVLFCAEFCLFVTVIAEMHLFINFVFTFSPRISSTTQRAFAL